MKGFENSPAGILRWPEGAASALNVSVPTLQRGRAIGDAPKLYALSERVLVTTTADLVEWVRAKAVPASYRCRPAVRRRGGKTPDNGEAA